MRRHIYSLIRWHLRRSEAKAHLVSVFGTGLWPSAEDLKTIGISKTGMWERRVEQKAQGVEMKLRK
jgi:hypothetical protein